MGADTLTSLPDSLVSDKTIAHWIPIRHKTLSDGDVKVYLSYDGNLWLVGTFKALDFIGLLHLSAVATDRIGGQSSKVDRGFQSVVS